MKTIMMTSGTTDYEEEISDSVTDYTKAAREAWPYARDHKGTCRYRVYDGDELIDEGTF